MASRCKNRPTAGWPFGLLLVAWLCANSPPVFTSAALTWLAKARHFSHQQRLTAEVACLLAGKEAPGLLEKIKRAPVKPATPPLPAEAALKKLDLAVERTVGSLAPAVGGFSWNACTQRPPRTWRAPPPQEPPRVRLVA